MPASRLGTCIKIDKQNPGRSKLDDENEISSHPIKQEHTRDLKIKKLIIKHQTIVRKQIKI